MVTNQSGLNNDAVIDDLEVAFEDLPEPTQDRLLRSAHRVVRGLAPPLSEPPGEEYREAVRDAEVAVIRFMVATDGGTLKSSSLEGVGNDSYAGLDAVQRMVASAMGGYYVGDEASPHPGSTGGAATVHNVSDEPLF